jgi:hypothetical protein
MRFCQNVNFSLMIRMDESKQLFSVASRLQITFGRLISWIALACSEFPSLE